VVFAESYGRVLLEREPFAEAMTATLTSAQDTLAAEGVQIRSALPDISGGRWP
jgi:hypothetical protein